MAEIKWVKLHTNMFQNSKLKHLRSLPEGDKLALIWIMLLATAGRCNANGWVFLTENIPYTPKMLAKEFDCRPSTVAAALHRLHHQVFCRNERQIFPDGFLNDLLIDPKPIGHILRKAQNRITAKEALRK